MQVNKIVYFALLLKRCVNIREPRSDTVVARIFHEALNSFRRNHRLVEGYEQNKRSIQYIITMAKELEIIFANNKLTPWGRTLEFSTPDEIPIELPIEFRIFFLRCFLLENYAFVKSLHDHLQKFREIRDEYPWYEKISTLPKNELINHAFSIYVQALKIASESVGNLATRRRYLKLYRQALRRGKTAKALYPKIKPSLGLMEDLNFIKKRKVNNNKISLSEKNGHKPYSEIMKRFSNYKTLVSEKNNLFPILLEAYGYTAKRGLSNQEIISNIENLYKRLSDPVFKVCDINTLTEMTVVQKGLEGYKLNEPEVKGTVIEASKKDMYRYQILPDRYGKNRFLKIKF